MQGSWRSIKEKVKDMLQSSQQRVLSTLDSWSVSGRNVGSTFSNILRWSRTSSGMLDNRETFSVFNYKHTTILHKIILFRLHIGFIGLLLSFIHTLTTSCLALLKACHYSDIVIYCIKTLKELTARSVISISYKIGLDLLLKGKGSPILGKCWDWNWTWYLGNQLTTNLVINPVVRKQLPSNLQRFTTLWLVQNYTAW